MRPKLRWQPRLPAGSHYQSVRRAVGADGATLVGLAGWAGAQALNNKIMPKQAAACEAREPPGLRI